MPKFRVLATVVLIALAAPLAAQVAQLPVNPLLKTPTIAIPLAFSDVPSGIIFVSVAEGTGTQAVPEIPIRIRTTGGKGSVSLAISVDGALPGRFSLINPPAITSFAGNTIVAPSTIGVQSIGTLEAAPVSKLLKISGTGSLPITMPADHVVTVTARESSGDEIRRSFTVRFVRAARKPILATSAGVSKLVAVDTSVNFTPAQLEVVPHGAVAFVPYNKVTLRPASGSFIPWHPLDPGSEVICLYGSFRYVCQIDSPPTEGGLPSMLTVRVPDIGRGNSVGIVLTGPYGESNAVAVTIDSLTSVILRDWLSTGALGGTNRYRAYPATLGADLLNNAEQLQCDKPYLVWKDLISAGPVYYNPPPGAPPISIKFSGEFTNRIVSVPRNELITNNVASWAVMESNVPVGLTNYYTQDMTYKYTTQVGECANRRR